MDEETKELLELAERYLGGFMGSASAYEKVEELRERIRAKLAAESPEAASDENT
jgi:hypothetical protein